MTQPVLLKRAYDELAKSDGFRVLIDRLWPRGISKVTLRLDMWAKDVAPSTELRKWFGHDPERWLEFGKRYKLELKHPEARRTIHDILGHTPIRSSVSRQTLFVFTTDADVGGRSRLESDTGSEACR